MSGMSARPEPQTWAWGDTEPEPTPGWEFETQWTMAGGEYTRVYTRPVIQHTEPAAPQLEAFRTRVDNGWVPFGWHLAYPTVRLEFDGTDECGNPVWERNAAWGLSVTEQEADRNARGGSGCVDCQSSTCQCDGTEAW